MSGGKPIGRLGDRESRGEAPQGRAAGSEDARIVRWP
jgi:hypothetical protein